ncbi:MAG TPA: hypothetical protein VEC38_07185 [Candidatus Binataceae bacterium]|nr:hypothetical protein [Candidatus Binataceae bacterium]
MSGSTVGLVNAAQINPGPVTTYTYDPSGNFSLNGSANIWPFLFEGGEHEVTDPASAYYDGSGNFYDPQIQRELAQLDATGLSQPSLGSVGGTAGANGGGGSARRGTGSVSGPRAANSAYRSAEADDCDCSVSYNPSGESSGNPIVAFFQWLGDLLGDLFGGGGSPQVVRQLMYKSHPLYVQILGIQPGLVPPEGSPVLELPSQGPYTPDPNESRPLREGVQNTPGGPVLVGKVVPFRKPEYYQRPDYLGEPRGKAKVYELRKYRTPPVFPPPAGTITDVGPLVIPLNALCDMYDQEILTGPRPQVCGPEPVY